ncbi:stalk domain-containing protein [Deinococcus budaensis]|uniref:Copper amine oxidase-like N-terminal domain-containing protein n=1 Tax=Deinococcus budaensis TaxID=1665626 RepID=A0A7W8GDN3_9DEIO|nr:hypothetical protein [Deinococcus budaensis]MBB5233640.1 hypothetical protein [Deinococcus budaensis]
MTRLVRFGLIASVLWLGLTPAPPRAQSADMPQVRVLLNSRELGAFPAAISGGRLLLPLPAFASLGWRPLLDPHNGVVDLAGCLRVRTTGREVFLIGGPGVIGVRTASALEPLPVAAQSRGGRTFLPAGALAAFLGYAVTFDRGAARVRFTLPGDPAKLDPVSEACLRNIGAVP